MEEENTDDTPDFSDEAYQAFDVAATNIISDGYAEVEIVNEDGDGVEAEPHAMDENGVGYFITRVVIEVTKVKVAS